MSNASVRERVNGRWEVRWSALDGRRRGRTFSSEGEAMDFRDGIRREQLSLDGGSLPAITVSRFVEDKWWPAAKARVARSTAATWRSELDNHVLPALSSRRLALVRVEDIDDLYRRRAEDGAAHASIMKLRSVLSNIWTEARRLGYVDSSPIELSRVPTRRSNRSDEVVFTLNEVRGIADGASRIWGGYAGPILIAAGAGLRWGEMAALTPEDVDLDGGLIRVNKSLSEVAGQFEVKEPKSRAGNRVTVFHASVKDALECQIGDWALPDLMFPSPRGHYLRRSNFARRVFRPSVDAAGLKSPNTFHSLRKTYATMLAEAGAPPRSISDLLGHAQVSTTLDLYSSRFAGDVDRMANLLGHRRLRVVG